MQRFGLKTKVVSDGDETKGLTKVNGEKVQSRERIVKKKMETVTEGDIKKSYRSESLLPNLHFFLSVNLFGLVQVFFNLFFLSKTQPLSSN